VGERGFVVCHCRVYRYLSLARASDWAARHCGVSSKSLPSRGRTLGCRSVFEPQYTLLAAGPFQRFTCFLFKRLLVWLHLLPGVCSTVDRDPSRFEMGVFRRKMVYGGDPANRWDAMCYKSLYLRYNTLIRF
jgi:hypothetical protein